ncbi:UNVERIFIED_CONTAM: hypothetical protein Sangu_1341100 [Sesamum angustifolium]|uniref:Nucleotide-diphospho-sugar transferase domain-containing protein n=1 Tax=Sesamum angustifolium TaxID=2727405 RepID=A0AAW2N339_9LAMI
MTTPFLWRSSPLYVSSKMTVPVPPDSPSYSRRPGVLRCVVMIVAAAVVSCFCSSRELLTPGSQVPLTCSQASIMAVPFLEIDTPTPLEISFLSGKLDHLGSSKNVSVVVASKILCEEYSLERVLKDASMQDNSVILTTLNEAWAAPNSVIDLFLESFRIGEQTRYLLNHLDADVMWFRDPFPHFHPDADFQIACDHFRGRSDDIENRPNGGFKFVRSNNRSIEFYRFWYSSHETYPGLHDQDVLNKIKKDSFIGEIGLKLRFLDTAYFGGFCEPSEDLYQVCTMHANCCFGLNSKLHDLRIMLEDWKRFLSSPPRLESYGWTVPQNCSLDSLRLDVNNQSPQG